MNKTITVFLGSALLLLSALTLLMGTTPAAAQNHLWSFARGGASASTYGEAVTLDAGGNVYVTGRFTGGADFGDSVLHYSYGGYGDYDIFVAKYDVDGQHVWSRTFGSSYADHGLAIAVDDSGNVVVGGLAGSGIDFGGGSLVGWPNTYEAFLVKLDPSGNHLWSKLFSESTDNRSNGVDIDSNGNVYVTGTFGHAIDFGGGFLPSYNGSDDVFLAKYAPDGSHIWSQHFGGTGADWGEGIVIDAMDNVVITGRYDGTVDFGGTALTGYGSYDLFLAKYDSSGSHLWSKGYGSSQSDTGIRICTFDQGDLVLLGVFNGDLNLGGATLTPQTRDFFLARFTSNGTHVWSRGYGGASYEDDVDLALDAQGNAFVTGSFSGTTDLGGSTLTSAGLSDIYFVRYNSSGNHVWSKGFGNTFADFGYGVAATPLGEVVFTGGSRLDIDFGGGPIGETTTTAFVVKYGDETSSPSIQTIVDVPNDQGRSVLISFDASSRDAPLSPTPIVRYDLYRRIDFLFAQARNVKLLEKAAPPGAWAFAGTVPAYGEATYYATAATLVDSTIVDGLQESVFFVRAGTADNLVFFDSQPDSGYSVDNLAPNVPTNFTYASQSLSWDEPTDADYRYNTVYGSNSGDFATATLITTTISTSLSVQMYPYSHYFVTATDFSGNEGEPAVTNVATGVGETPVAFHLMGAVPNPFSPRTTVIFELPEVSRVHLAVYDLSGRLVRTLLNGQEVPRGRREAVWDGRNDAGLGVAAGTYFCRMKAGTFRDTICITLVK